MAKSPWCRDPLPATVVTANPPRTATDEEDPAVAVHEPAVVERAVVPVCAIPTSTGPTANTGCADSSAAAKAGATHAGTGPATAHMGASYMTSPTTTHVAAAPCAARANEGNNEIAKADRILRMRLSYVLFKLRNTGARENPAQLSRSLDRQRRIQTSRSSLASNSSINAAASFSARVARETLRTHASVRSHFSLRGLSGARRGLEPTGRGWRFNKKFVPSAAAH